MGLCWLYGRFEFPPPPPIDFVWRFVVAMVVENVQTLCFLSAVQPVQPLLERHYAVAADVGAASNPICQALSNKRKTSHTCTLEENISEAASLKYIHLLSYGLFS